MIAAAPARGPVHVRRKGSVRRAPAASWTTSLCLPAGRRGRARVVSLGPSRPVRVVSGMSRPRPRRRSPTSTVVSCPPTSRRSVAVALPRRRRPGTTAAARRPGTADVLASATFSGPSGAGLVGGHRRLDAGLRDARRGRVAAVGIGEVRRLGERAGVDGDAGGVEHLLGALERIEPVGDRPHRRLAPARPGQGGGVLAARDLLEHLLQGRELARALVGRRAEHVVALARGRDAAVQVDAVDVEALGDGLAPARGEQLERVAHAEVLLAPSLARIRSPGLAERCTPARATSASRSSRRTVTPPGFALWLARMSFSWPGG